MKTLPALALLLAAIPLAAADVSERDRLKKELTLQPGDAAAHYRLGQLFEAEGFRVPAILEYLRLLAIETGTPRVNDAAKRLMALLNTGVNEKKAGEVTIAFDDEAPKQEGDFSGHELFFAMAAAAQFTEEEVKKTEFERVRSQLLTVLGLLVESPPKGDNHTARQNIPFFLQMEEKKVLETFAGLALLSLNLDGAAAWEKANEAAIGEYRAFIRGLPR
jgi:hypothetical protein